MLNAQKSFMQRMRRTDGYTIDQTILIVAIIAILVTLVILTVGWNIINKASGTKLAAQLKQIEDATGQFYAQHRSWPHLSYTSPAATAALNVVALANGTGIATWAPNVVATQRRNLLSGMQIVSNVVQHSFANGGAINMQANTANAWGLNAANLYYVVQLAGVPISEARNADAAIDATPDTSADDGAGTGRLVYTPVANTCMNGTAGGAVPAPTAPGTASTVNVCYAANLIQ